MTPKYAIDCIKNIEQTQVLIEVFFISAKDNLVASITMWFVALPFNLK